MFSYPNADHKQVANHTELTRFPHASVKPFQLCAKKWSCSELLGNSLYLTSQISEWLSTYLALKTHTWIFVKNKARDFRVWCGVLVAPGVALCFYAMTGAQPTTHDTI